MSKSRASRERAASKDASRRRRREKRSLEGTWLEAVGGEEIPAFVLAGADESDEVWVPWASVEDYLFDRGSSLEAIERDERMFVRAGLMVMLATSASEEDEVQAVAIARTRVSGPIVEIPAGVRPGDFIRAYFDEQESNAAARPVVVELPDGRWVQPAESSGPERLARRTGRTPQEYIEVERKLIEIGVLVG